MNTGMERSRKRRQSNEPELVWQRANLTVAFHASATPVQRQRLSNIRSDLSHRHSEHLVKISAQLVTTRKSGELRDIVEVVTGNDLAKCATNPRHSNPIPHVTTGPGS